MCLIIFAHQCHPRYPLLLAANRDEFFARPTAAAAFWPEHPDLLAGRDLRAGGTWMGVTRDGRFAAITNFRDPQRSEPGQRSRGELPLAYLVGHDSAEHCLERIEASADAYAGFNLLLGHGEAMWYYSNADATGPVLLAPGIYGLSNASLDTPWPKVELGKQRMGTLLNQPVDHQRLQWTVQDPELAPEADLHPLGLNEAMDRQLSAQFIRAGAYGTRATTTLWREPSGALYWRECSFDDSGRQRAVVNETLAPAASPADGRD